MTNEHDNTLAAVFGGTTITTLVTSKFDSFDNDGIFFCVFVVFFLSYSMGSLWAGYQHLSGKEKFSLEKSVKGISRLLVWFSCFTMFHLVKHAIPAFSPLAWFMELAILLTECGFLFRKGWEITGILFLKKSADAIEEVREHAAEKFDKGIKSLLKDGREDQKKEK